MRLCTGLFPCNNGKPSAQVINFGAWYPRYSVLDPHHPWPAWQTDMKELINERLSTYRATTFWRSYAAAHYGGINGTNTFEEVSLSLSALYSHLCASPPTEVTTILAVVCCC